jgi:hypothetical protein
VRYSILYNNAFLFFSTRKVGIFGLLQTHHREDGAVEPLTTRTAAADDQRAGKQKANQLRR